MKIMVFLFSFDNSPLQSTDKHYNYPLQSIDKHYNSPVITIPRQALHYNLLGSMYNSLSTSAEELLTKVQATSAPMAEWNTKASLIK